MRSRAFTLALSLLTAAAALVALPSATAPAGAAVQPCTVSYAAPTNVAIPPKGSNPSHSFVIIPFDVTDTRVVTDLALAIDITHASGGSLHLHLHGSRSKGLSAMQAHNLDQTSGAWNGRYLFDEETGSAPVSGANPAPGTYKPASPEELLEGSPAYPGTDTWNLWVLNYSEVAGTMRGMTLTLTYATCDSDGDGVEERSDNCPGVANDQANRDDDTLGDACDLDADGDALANTADGCPLVGATTRTGCPGVGRTASLARTKKGKRLSLAVGSTVPACQSEARATLWRKKPGRDIKLVVATTSSRGRYSLRAPSRSGRYYATVARSYAPGQAECGAARSRALRVSSRAATGSTMPSTAAPVWPATTRPAARR